MTRVGSQRHKKKDGPNNEMLKNYSQRSPSEIDCLSFVTSLVEFAQPDAYIPILFNTLRTGEADLRF